MANSKNTIQNIPLTGELCLNTLKTDVKQFEGYNEKNTTVFGGELTNIRSKKSVSYTDYKTKHLHNSKGDDFEISVLEGTIKKNGVVVYQKKSDPSPSGRVIRRINLNEIIPEKEVIWAAVYEMPHFSWPLKVYYVAEESTANTTDVCLFYLVKQPNGEIEKFKLETLSRNSGKSVPWKSATYKIHTDGPAIVFSACGIYSDNEVYFGIVTQTFSQQQTGEIASSRFYLINADFQGAPIISFDRTYGDTARAFVYLNPFSGYKEIKTDEDLSNLDNNGHIWSVDSQGVISNMDEPEGSPPEHHGSYLIQHLTNTYYVSSVDLLYPGNKPYAVELGAWSVSKYVSTFDSNNNFLYGVNTDYTTGFAVKEGKTGYTDKLNGGLPILKKVVGDFHVGCCVYTLHTHVISISLFGMPVCTPTSIENNNITFVSSPAEGVTYKSNGIWWFTGFPKVDFSDMIATVEDLYDNIIVDDRYVLFPIWKTHQNGDVLIYDSGYCLAYDIETSSITDEFKYLGYIFSEFPVTDSSFTETTGAVYAGGYNSAFEISKSPFTGYLPNPTVVAGIKGNFEKWSGDVPAEINTYLSIGDSVTSAEYNGTNPEYAGTTYSIDANANVILPLTASSKIIKGYSNNDLIDTGSSVYPLIYYNNTNKLYSYYLLSSIENMKCAFALQGQQYGVTDENILAVTISNGVLSNVSTVAYVKDMTFLGTLPTSAVFYSKLNKTFYRFTGDSILSKMFEASDIDEIGIVGQNPASLSLWICTDRGVYVISDTDMYKLDYKADNVSFCDSFVIIDEDDFDTEQNKYRHTSSKISIYDIGDGAEEQPIKLQTKYYGLGSELKANYDCWYIRLHSKKHKAGKLKLKVNTITNTSFETEEKTFDIEPSMYDTNSQIFIRYQPKYQSAVATQLELESDIAIYQISLGINQTDATAQVSKFNF